MPLFNYDAEAKYTKTHNFYLYRSSPTKCRGLLSTPRVNNLIISAKSGIILEERPYAHHMFLVQFGFRLLFYCPHGTTLTSNPTAPTPVLLMNGNYEAYETITDGQLCYSYILCPEPKFNKETGRSLIIDTYLDILKTNREERGESKSKKDKYPAHNYDILVPDAPVSLRRVLQEVKKRYPQYFHFHCLFSRSEEFTADRKYDPYKLPPRFYQGSLGRWECLDEPLDAGASTSSAGTSTSNAGFRSESFGDKIEGVWLFLETSFNDYGAI